MSNTNQLASLKVGANSIIINAFVVIRQKRNLYRVGELCGDWLMHGTRQEIEERIRKAK